MNKQTLKNKRELAKALYIKAEHTQAEISEIVGVSRRSICKWIEKEDWKSLRNATTITPQKIVSNLNKQLDEINERILSRPEGERFATPKESDSILKLATTIKKMQTDCGLAEVVSVAMSFLSWLRDIGEEELGKEFSNYFNAFIADIAERAKREK